MNKTQDVNNTNEPQKKYHLGTVSNNILLEGFNQFHGVNLVFNSDMDQDTTFFFWGGGGGAVHEIFINVVCVTS